MTLNMDIGKEFSKLFSMFLRSDHKYYRRLKGRILKR